ncbi:MAG: homoserine dehydrogenase, partial [Armatimonadetes bacterium]|nr:homoserine dehydrogenase [Armatimonadota bacterium]
FQVRRVAVAHPDKPRAVPVDRALLTGDAWEVVTDPRIDVVVEVMGGIEPARSYVLRALEQRKSVVTANKQLMANRGRELLDAAEAAGVDLCFEASVGGGIPLIRPIKEGLAANRIVEVTGILNGTTNYILTRMTREGWTFSEALSEAQARGFAEQDPTDDVEGHDAAAKLAILASVCFNTRVTASDVPREGISRISPRDVEYARELGYVIKLLAIGRQVDGQVEVRVHPAMIPTSHPLAAVTDEYNAVLVRGDAVGEVMFYGRGAGGGPTASAIIADLVDVGRNRRLGAAGRLGCTCYRSTPIRDPDLSEACFYLGLQAADQPGVFARIAAVFGEEGVSIASIVQKSRGEVADIVLVTHRTQEARMRRVLPRLRELAVLKEVSSVIRVEVDEA